MLEKRLNAVPPQLFTTDGTANGKITVSNTVLFKVKQVVSVGNNTLQPQELEVKRIDDINTMWLGPLSQTIDKRSDMSAYTLASGAFIFANEQKRPSIPSEEFNRAMYEEEPTVAQRSVLVDKLGNKIDNVVDSNGVNRLAVDGQFSAEVDVQVDVDIEGVYDPVDNPDPDNIGVIGVTRTVNPDETDQVQRISAKQGTIDTDTHSMDVSIHDHDGNAFRKENPLPVSGSFEKFFSIVNASNWMKLANYDEVVPTYSLDGKTLTMAYKEDGALLGEAVVYFNTDMDWNIVLHRYIDDDDGTQLLDDDDTPLNLD